MLTVKYKLTLISVKEGCFWYPTSYEFINLNSTGIICLRQKKTLPHSVYTIAFANNFGTHLHFYCLLLQWILNWSKSYMYVPGERVNYITHSESVYKSQWKHTVNIPTHQVGSFKNRYCTHRILGYTVRYLGWGGGGGVISSCTINDNQNEATAVYKLWYYAQHYNTQPTTTAWTKLWRQTKTLAYILNSLRLFLKHWFSDTYRLTHF